VPVAQAQNIARRERERERELAEGAKQPWTYYAGEEETSSPVAASAAAHGMKPATRTITNQDIQQVNQNNGTVKYDGKTEQIK
jgi:hypothetical protein